VPYDEHVQLGSGGDDEWAARMQKLNQEFDKKGRRRRPARMSPSASDAGEGRAQRRSGRSSSKSIVALVLVFALGYGALHFLGRSDPSGNRQAVVPVLNSVAPSQSSVAPQDPFANTPARYWPAADVGVVMPAAGPLGPYAPDLVQGALDRAHQYLLVARTDPSILTDHNLGTAEALLDPEYLTKFAGSDEAGALAITRLAPDERLTDPVRVNGTVVDAYAAALPGGDQAHVSVTADLVWAYAMTPPDRAPRESNVVVIHENTTLSFYLGIDPAAKVWISSTDQFDFNINCAYSHQGLLSLPRDADRVSHTASALSDGQIYDPRTQLSSIEDSCIGTPTAAVPS
jgi:hypothetical protein